MDLKEVINILEASLKCLSVPTKCNECCLVSEDCGCNKKIEAAEEKAIEILKDLEKYINCKSGCSDCMVLDKYR